MIDFTSPFLDVNSSRHRSFFRIKEKNWLNMRLCTNKCTLHIQRYFSLSLKISPNPPFPFPSSLCVSLFLLIHSSFSLCLAEYLHLSDVICFIFFLTHISVSSTVPLSPLSPRSSSNLSLPSLLPLVSMLGVYVCAGA